MVDKDYPFLDNTQADLRLLGMPNLLSSFTQFNSASRVSMFNHHLSQTMILDNPDFNKIFTGVEEKMIPYTFNDSRRKHPCEILAVIPKYMPIVNNFKIDDCPQFYVIVLTIESKAGKPVRHLDYFTIDRYTMGNNGFGYQRHIENIDRVVPDGFLDPDTVITRSPAVQGDQYCLGANLNVVLGSFPETIEDAFIISESAANKLQTTQVSKITLNCRQDRRPLNLNGTADEEKFLPDIGSYVRDDGILCAFRTGKWETCLADTAPDALRQPLHLQDEIYTIEPGAKIVDLTFNVNMDKISTCYDQALLYMRNHTRCWENIYQVYLKNKDSCDGLTKKMSELVARAMYRMVAHGSRVSLLDGALRKEVKNFDIEGVGRQTIDFLQVEVVYTVPRKVNNGDKITDFAGAKGVIAHVYPDEMMPIDEYGIRADMMVDMNSPVSRNNPGQLYEMGINRISEFARRAIKKTCEEQGHEPAFEKLMEWYGDVNPNYEKLIRSAVTDSRDKKSVVTEAIETSPKIWIPPFLNTLTPKPDDKWHALRNIKSWAKKWGCKPSRIKYSIRQADGSFKQFISDAEFSIGSKYIIHLHKIPEIAAPGFAAVNHMGIPTKSNFDNKYSPVSNNPYRYGEDELRLLCMDADSREVTRFQNLMANSPKGVASAIQTLLLVDSPTRISRVPISNGDLLKSSAPLRLFHNTTATLGVDTKDTITEAFDVSDELSESIWQSVSEDGEKGDGSSSDDEVVARRRKSRAKRTKKMMDDLLAVEADDDDEIPKPEEDSDEDGSDEIVESPEEEE